MYGADMTTPIKVTPTSIRMTEETRSSVIGYAKRNGISMAAAFNLLVRKGLRAAETEEQRRP